MRHAAILLIATLMTSFAVAAEAPVTAFKARDIAAKEIHNESKSKVIAIYGKKSTVSTMPSEWLVLFYDPYAKQDGRLIKVAGGSVVGIEDGYSQLDDLRLAAYKPEEIIDPNKLKIDSDAAIDSLKSATALKNVQITGVEMKVLKTDETALVPVWFITVYASKKNSGKGVKIGDAQVSATTGQVLQLNINLKKLD